MNGRNGRVFLDTNVLIYADDRSADKKRAQAQAVIRTLISTDRAVLSTQVLQEYYVIATRKLGIASPDARARVETFARLNVVVVVPEVILGAIDLSRLHTLSFWDALVVKSASSAGCTRILSEDLNAGQVVDGVRIDNPFAATFAL
jgi:predicted nucleic acid-binding protein